MNTLPLIRIAIADDHTLIRVGLTELINKFEAMSVIIQADNGQHLLNQLTDAPILPGICILDYSMPVMDGYETLLKIKKAFPQIKVLALSMHDNEYNIIRMIKGGAGGYLMKDCEPEDLKLAIRSIYETDVYYSKDISEHLFETAKETIVPNLSEREIQYLTHCCESLSDKEIAAKMDIQSRSAEGYRKVLCDKLNVKNKAHLAIFAIRTGIVK